MVGWWVVGERFVLSLFGEAGGARLFWVVKVNSNDFACSRLEVMLGG